MDPRRDERDSILVERSEYPDPDPGYTPVYPWAGAPTKPNQPPHTRLNVLPDLDHRLWGGTEALREPEDSSTYRHGSHSTSNVVDSVYVDPDIELVHDNSM